MFLEEAGSASGFGLELRLSKRVVRAQSWGWLGIRQKHWAEEELASGRVQGWDYTACEKSRNEQWAWEGPQVNKVRTAQQFCNKSLPQYICRWVIAGSSLMFFNWSKGKALPDKKSKPAPAGLWKEKEIKNMDPDTCPRELGNFISYSTKKAGAWSARHNSLRRCVCHVRAGKTLGPTGVTLERSHLPADTSMSEEVCWEKLRRMLLATKI